MRISAAAAGSLLLAACSSTPSGLRPVPANARLAEPLAALPAAAAPAAARVAQPVAGPLAKPAANLVAKPAANPAAGAPAVAPAPVVARRAAAPAGAAASPAAPANALTALSSGAAEPWQPPLLPRQEDPTADLPESDEVLAPREKTWVEGGFDDVSLALSAATLGAFLPLIAEGNERDIEQVGDYTVVLGNLAAIGLTAGARDLDGFYQWGISTLGTQALVEVTKKIAQKARPNALSTQSFPSGHAAGAFSPAAFVTTRYGLRFGAPLYINAVYVAYSRVQANKHHIDDVLAGASYALIVNWLAVEPISKNWAISPTSVAGGPGVSLEFIGSPDDPRDRRKWRPSSGDAETFRYQFEFGPTWQDRNEVQAPPNSGTPIDFARLDGSANPTTMATGTFQWRFKGPHEFNLRWQPFEAREFTDSLDGGNFGGAPIPPNTPLRTEFRMSDIRSTYRYDFSPDGPWLFKLGAALSAINTEYAILDANTAEGVTVSDLAFIPLLHVHGGYRFNEHWSLFGEVDGGANNDNYLAEGKIDLRYDFANRWDLGIGYRAYLYDIEERNLGQKLDLHRIAFSVGYAH
ncbi:MAG: phosphatase PAP2 family protein [Planctomycetota bacterium]